MPKGIGYKGDKARGKKSTVKVVSTSKRTTPSRSAIKKSGRASR